MPGELLIGHFAFFLMLGSERALAFTNSYSSRTDKRRVLISPPNFITTARWQTKHHRPSSRLLRKRFLVLRPSRFGVSFWLFFHLRAVGCLPPSRRYSAATSHVRKFGNLAAQLAERESPLQG